MLYAVIACEDMYDGMHGMVDYFVIEGTEEDAYREGETASYDIMQEYGCIWEDIEESAKDRLEYEGEDEDEVDGELYERLLDEVMRDDVVVEVYPITKETTRSIEQLNDEFYNDPETFIREYCELPNFSNGYR